MWYRCGRERLDYRQHSQPPVEYCSWADKRWRLFPKWSDLRLSIIRLVQVLSLKLEMLTHSGISEMSSKCIVHFDESVLKNKFEILFITFKPVVDKFWHVFIAELGTSVTTVAIEHGHIENVWFEFLCTKKMCKWSLWSANSTLTASNLRSSVFCPWHWRRPPRRCLFSESVSHVWCFAVVVDWNRFDYPCKDRKV